MRLTRGHERSRKSGRSHALWRAVEKVWINASAGPYHVGYVVCGYWGQWFVGIARHYRGSVDRRGLYRSE